MENNLEIRAQASPWNMEIEFLLRQEASGGMFAFGTSVIMETMEPGSAIIHPTFSLTLHEARKLMGQLWDCGIRPPQIKGDSETLKATQQHLEDMRSIAFKKLGMDLGVTNDNRD